MRHAAVALGASGHAALAERVYASSLRIREQALAGPFLPPGVSIAPPADARNKFLPSECELKGIALYDDEYDALDLDESLHSKLSETGKAGLYFHEAIYKDLRARYHVKDSRAARAITACAFATPPCPTLFLDDGVPTKDAYVCETRAESGQRETRFSLFRGAEVSGPKGRVYWRFQFDEIAGEAPPAKTYFDVIGSRLSVQSAIPRAIDSRLARRYTTRSDESRWKNIELSFSFQLDGGDSDTLLLDGLPVRCVSRN
jgi:hypothetical protein